MRQTIIALLIGLMLPVAVLSGERDKAQQAAFGNAQWIGAITQRDALLPQGRNFTGAKLKEPAVKAAWAAVDTLAARSIYLRRDANLRGKVRQATVYVCGLGFYELAINGQKVGDAEFAPLWSDYDKSVFYNEYDVTSLLTRHDSQLVLQVLLGNGFYNEPGRRYAKMKIAFGPPTLLFRMHIDYADGSSEDIVSDQQWQWALSPITFNSIYGGEDYDARLEERGRTKDEGGTRKDEGGTRKDEGGTRKDEGGTRKDEGGTRKDEGGTRKDEGGTRKDEGGTRKDIWRPVVIQEAPRGVLRRQMAEPVKIMERYGVKDTVVSRDSVLVLDMGQNLSGFPEISVLGRRGQHVKLIPSETLTPDGLVNQKQTGRPHYYIYILRGNGDTETWHPRFSYYGYRYLQVEGDIEVLRKVESCFVYNSARKTGSFECSNVLLNDAYRLIDRAIRSNWQAVWTDCPHREKLGWLEQDWLNGEGLVSNYDCRSFIEQTMQNISDAQFANGALPEIAPNLCVFEGSWAPPFLESPEWGGAFIALPFLYKEYYGDDRVVTYYQGQMKRYVDYLATQDSCYILRQGLGDWYDYGPGRAGFAQNTPMPLVSTAHYYWWTRLVGEMMGDDSEARALTARADSIRQAFIREFYHPATHQFGTGSQCANAIALEMGLVPEGDRQAVLRNLIDDIHAHGDRLTTGDVGNRYLFNALIHNGQQELLYKMLNHYDVPGYGYQIKLGHTTLTEQWNPEHGASMNHFMMGHLNNLLVPYFLGIWQQGGTPVIAPHPVGDLTWCRGTSGGVSVAWRIEDGTFHLDADIPEGRTATVTMPYSQRQFEATAGHHSWAEPLAAF